MTRIRLAAGAGLAALALAAGSTAMTHPKLTGVVGPGFTISIKNAQGKAVKNLKVGTYTIAVTDKSKIHNWVLEGPGLGKKGKEITSTPFVGKKSATVTVKKGVYTFVCTPHRTVPTMKGTFKVA
ncbi:MAG: hypothetical protein H0V84_03900 [Actinobacteria bacterium]|nr:hypothetical protein [Actinomycetota bacterium]